MEINLDILPTAKRTIPGGLYINRKDKTVTKKNFRVVGLRTQKGKLDTLEITEIMKFC